MPQRHKIHVGYKSGATDVYTCDSCKVSYNTATSKLEQILWKNPKPDILFMDVASVTVIKNLSTAPRAK